jgi:hypothetical protein
MHPNPAQPAAPAGQGNTGMPGTGRKYLLSMRHVEIAHLIIRQVRSLLALLVQKCKC